MIPLKSEEDLKALRLSGGILAKVMRKLSEAVRPGIATIELDRLAANLIAQEHALAAFKGYKGFPASICASVNAEVVHGVPSERLLCQGDIISIDLGVNYQGYFTDAAITVPVGKISSDLKRLLETAKKALSEGISRARVDNRLSDISCRIQGIAEAQGLSVVRQYVGHGIGLSLHEEPEIPNFGKPHSGPVLKSGMVFAIEPMVNIGTWETEVLDNGWTAITKDRAYSAHFEHTVAITENGPEILTN